MALFGETKKPFTYDILREGEETILLIDLEQYPHIPSLEDDPVCMSRTADILAESGIVESKSDARRQMEQGGVKVGGKVISDWRAEIALKPGLVIQVGSRKFIRLSNEKN